MAAEPVGQEVFYKENTWPRKTYVGPAPILPTVQVCKHVIDEVVVGVFRHALGVRGHTCSIALLV